MDRRTEGREKAAGNNNEVKEEEERLIQRRRLSQLPWTHTKGSHLWWFVTQGAFPLTIFVRREGRGE